jgi:hypothetical protein
VTPECQAIPTAAELQMHDEPFDEPLLSDSVRDYVMAEAVEYLWKTTRINYYKSFYKCNYSEYIQITVLIISDLQNEMQSFSKKVTSIKQKTCCLPIILSCVRDSKWDMDL